MSKKIIILYLFLIFLILLISIVLKVNTIEFFTRANPKDIYTSREFNTITKSNNSAAKRQFKDTADNFILKRYRNLSYTDVVSEYNNYKNNLFTDYLVKEEDSINTMLTGDSNIKLVYLTESNPSTNSYYNKAGEYMRNIQGDVYVWQPLSYWMLSDNAISLKSKITSSSRGPYIECWIREDMRSGTLAIPRRIKRKYRLSRPKESDIFLYENAGYNFTYESKNKIRTGNKVIRYIGYRKDGIRDFPTDRRQRIFDKQGDNITSGAEAYNEYKKKGYSRYNDYWNNKKYKKYVEDSVNYLNGNAKCFGLQWKSGELFYSENNDICDDIENKNTHSLGWPNGWALNFYRIEQANDNINDNIYRENANLTDSEAQARRNNIRRSNNKILKLKGDLLNKNI